MLTLLSLECVSRGVWRLRVVRAERCIGQVSTVEGNLASVRAIAASVLGALGPAYAEGVSLRAGGRHPAESVRHGLYGGAPKHDLAVRQAAVDDGRLEARCQG